MQKKTMIRILKDFPGIKIPILEDTVLEIVLNNSTSNAMIYDFYKLMEEQGKKPVFLISQLRKTRYFELGLERAGCNKMNIYNLAEKYDIRNDNNTFNDFVKETIKDIKKEEKSDTLIIEDFEDFMDFYPLPPELQHLSYKPLIETFREEFDIILYSGLNQDDVHYFIKPEIIIDLDKIVKKGLEMGMLPTERDEYLEKFKDYDYLLSIHNRMGLDLGVGKKNVHKYLFSKDGKNKKPAKSKDIKGIIIKTKKKFLE